MGDGNAPNILMMSWHTRHRVTSKNHNASYPYGARTALCFIWLAGPAGDNYETLPMTAEEVTQAVAAVVEAGSPQPSPSPGLTSQQRRSQYQQPGDRQEDGPSGGAEKPEAGAGGKDGSEDRD